MDGHGILSDNEIRTAYALGKIEIDPFNPENLNPTSLDLTLGEEVAVYKRWVAYDEDFDRRPRVGNVEVGISRAEIIGRVRDGDDMHSIRDAVLDVRKEPEVAKFKIHPDRGWILKPGIGYLMHTRERVRTESFVPVLDGKSSIGRLFVKVHETAGYGDPGFDGQYTLEVTVQHPIRLYPGMRICQIRFHTIAGEVGKTYDKVGHYTQEAAKGAVASQAWKQFQR